MTSGPSPDPARERGAALLLTLVVAAALAVIGVALALLADTDRRVAAHAAHGEIARRAAVAGVFAVATWFDAPVTASTLPPIAVVDRGLRRIDPDGPGPTPSAAASAYRAGVDRDGDGRDDLFAPPWHGAPEAVLSGSADGPDVRIESPAAAGWLAGLTASLVNAAPLPGTVLDLTRIDIFGPRVVPVGAAPRRLGLARVRVTARLSARASGRVLARRTVEGSLDAFPWPAVWAAVHAGDGLRLDPGAAVRWGAIHAGCPDDGCTDGIALDVGDVVPGLPHAPPADAAHWSPWGPGFSAGFDDWALAAAGAVLRDPWRRVVAGGVIAGAPPAPHPFPSPWAAWSPGASPPTSLDPCCDRSAAVRISGVPLPAPDRRRLGAVARRGAPRVRRFRWVGADRFREEGGGPERSFGEWADGARGVLVFETTDGLPPRADGGNLTPPIEVDRPEWSVDGLVVLQASGLTLRSTGRPAVLRAPPGPWVDRDGDGRPGPLEPRIGLAAPPDPAGTWAVAPAPAPGAPDRGPAMTAGVAVRGVLLVDGPVTLVGDTRVYGSVVAAGRVALRAGGGAAPQVLWNADVTGDWPPPGGAVPRVVITGLRDVAGPAG